MHFAPVSLQEGEAVAERRFAIAMGLRRNQAAAVEILI
jgi:hypothetical protein